MKAALLLFSAPLLLAASASAQEAQSEPQLAAPVAADVSDDEVSRFALAALVVEQLARDESLDQEQKQGAMMDIVQQVGLEPDRYNQIAMASQSDAELTERISLAAAAHVEMAQQNQ